jgi:hypothetical protein
VLIGSTFKANLKWTRDVNDLRANSRRSWWWTSLGKTCNEHERLIWPLPPCGTSSVNKKIFNPLLIKKMVNEILIEKILICLTNLTLLDLNLWKSLLKPNKLPDASWVRFRWERKFRIESKVPIGPRPDWSGQYWRACNT